ncbi:hypothetical protein RFI_00004 [Reticulomyxa filosa]|uniref:Transmembrane protein n=1 Tax=Reticulomyxa filosa TaxID=46433 RepID=X6PG25_RETFI|nr:hypothetical protein RFI_00004 [Reticulomyxa filosa]|eukprot:ETO37058.1 hypothetical protein RFI_00004 [Reticulomyxa filosa]
MTHKSQKIQERLVAANSIYFPFFRKKKIDVEFDQYMISLRMFIFFYFFIIFKIFIIEKKYKKYEETAKKCIKSNIAKTKQNHFIIQQKNHSQVFRIAMIPNSLAIAFAILICNTFFIHCQTKKKNTYIQYLFENTYVRTYKKIITILHHSNFQIDIATIMLLCCVRIYINNLLFFIKMNVLFEPI